MKLLIDISDEKYNRIKEWADGVTDYQTTLALYRAVRDGKPYEETNLVEYISLYKKKEEFYKSQGQDVTAREMSFIAELLQEIKSEQRPQGEWIKKVDDVGFISYICSQCGFELELEDCSDSYYCTNCGADMRGEE